MKTYKGRVEHGRVVIAGASKLPEGAVVRITVESPRGRPAKTNEHALDVEDPEQRAALEACFRVAERDLKAGRARPSREIIARLEAKRIPR